MIEVVLGLGANCGDREKSLSDTLRWLGSFLCRFRHSAIYETPCMGKEGAPYMNSVASGIYSGSLSSFSEILKERERISGRDEACRQKGDVPIDIDIVICDGKVLKEWDFRQKFFRTGYEELKEHF